MRMQACCTRATGCECGLLPCHEKRSRAKIMHRVVRPTKAFIPRQRHAAEGGCTTWVHRTAASAKCSLLHQMQAAEQKLCCANGARRAECSAFLQSEMRLSANAGFFVAERALLRKCSPSGRSAALGEFARQ